MYLDQWGWGLDLKLKDEGIENADCLQNVFLFCGGGGLGVFNLMGIYFGKGRGCESCCSVLQLCCTL